MNQVHKYILKILKDTFEGKIKFSFKTKSEILGAERKIRISFKLKKFNKDWLATTILRHIGEIDKIYIQNQKPNQNWNFYLEDRLFNLTLIDFQVVYLMMIAPEDVWILN